MHRPIGIFDSGVGGLTVMREVIDLLPGEDIIYFGDTKRCPYGPKDLHDVRRFVFEIIEFLIEQDVKMIIIACNTGTAAGLEIAQKEYRLPIIGVIEPGARGAVLSTKNKKVGVIGTVGTINSGAYQKIINSLDAGVEVYSKACPDFVDFVERGETEGGEVLSVAEGYLKDLKEKNVDSLILGCTHYPLLKNIVQQVMGPDVTLISSAEEVALEAREILQRQEILSGKKTGSYRFYSTNDKQLFLELGKKFLGAEISDVEQVELG